MKEIFELLTQYGNVDQAIKRGEKLLKMHEEIGNTHSKAKMKPAITVFEMITGVCYYFADAGKRGVKGEKVVLLYFKPRVTIPGALFKYYISGYLVFRFFSEFFRENERLWEYFLFSCLIDWVVNRVYNFYMD